MNIDQIIAKVFADKATQEELQALEVWKQQASENINAIKQMRSIDAAVDSLEDYKDFGVDDAWAQMEAKMDKGTSSNKIVDEKAKVIGFPWLRSVAAASVILLLGVFGWQTLTSDHSVDTLESFVSLESKLDALLADGSKVLLDSNTKLIPSTSRNVSLEGRAYFDIAKQDGSQFTIDLAQGKVTVLGTQFVVNTREEKVKIYVTEGKVMYELNGRKVVLEAGDQLIMKDGDINKFKSDGKGLTEWMSTKLTFRDKSLKEVIKTLNDHYNVQLVLDNPGKAANCSVTTTFKSENINEVLNELSLTLGLKYHTKDGIIHIVETNC